MQDKEKGGLEKLSVKNTLKLAMEQEPSKHLRGGLYGNMDDKKSQILSGIIADGMMDLMEASGRPQVKKNDLEAIRERTMEYIQNRIQERRLPTVEGWAVSMGITRDRLYDWLNDQKVPEVYSFLRQVHEAFSDMHASAAMNNVTNPVAWIFYSKNRFGFMDKTELSIEPGNTHHMGEDVTPEQLEEKYADVIVDEVPDVKSDT